MNLTWWALSALTFILTFLVLYVIKHIFWKYAANNGAKKLLFQRLNTPFYILVAIISLGIAQIFIPEKIRSELFATQVFKILLILVFIWILDRIISVFFASSFITSVTGGGRNLSHTIVRVLFLVVGVLVVLETLGISITPILASLGIGSLAVALALQDTLGNFFSGIYLLVDKPIRVGDFVEIEGGTVGTVIKIGWRSTQIKMPANNIVVIPNSKIASAKIINYDLSEPEMAVLVDVGVSYNSDLKHVERVATEVAGDVLKTVEGGVSDFVPFIRYNLFSDSSINFTVILRGKQFVDQHIIKHEFIKRLHERFKQENIEIPFPQRVVHSVNEPK
ncbi:MAG: mechanosensitive ion channel family protein [Oligoflexia bacterium]|nr:mechanosensitive ion channel family protein [Oligoflexia bacterium]